jgi:hypothetical protein
MIDQSLNISVAPHADLEYAFTVKSVLDEPSAVVGAIGATIIGALVV